jgi:hypothetical protein
MKLGTPWGKHSQLEKRYERMLVWGTEPFASDRST